MVPYARTDDFKIDNLPEVKKYSGLFFWQHSIEKKLFGVLKFKNNTTLKTGFISLIDIKPALKLIIMNLIISYVNFRAW
jgi:hypothetical protein